jgi:hypothetical protein
MTADERAELALAHAATQYIWVRDAKYLAVVRPAPPSLVDLPARFGAVSEEERAQHGCNTSMVSWLPLGRLLARRGDARQFTAADDRQEGVGAPPSPVLVKLLRVGAPLFKAIAQGPTDASVTLLDEVDSVVAEFRQLSVMPSSRAGPM